jgi:thymidylate synthase (FAD)
MYSIPSEVFHTPGGTPYLKEAGLSLLAHPSFNESKMSGFTGGFDEELGFSDYLKDDEFLGYGTGLAKTAGQLCYMSLSEKRTHNKDAQKYFDNIRTQGHGSILEHANYSFLAWGVSRSLTHELVRHRAGTAFSQVSQRFVDGKVLRFVERPEYQKHIELHVGSHRE